MQELRYNEVRGEQIIAKNLDAAANPDAAILTIKNVRVHSVRKDPQWKGTIVMTYEVAKGEVLFGVVYVDLLPAANMANLQHDDRVSIIGAAYSYETHTKNATLPSAAIRIYGVVVPEFRKPGHHKP